MGVGNKEGEGGGGGGEKVVQISCPHFKRGSLLLYYFLSH